MIKSRIVSYIKSHKLISAIVLIAVIGGYYGYRSINTTTAAPQYVVQRASMGTITQTVTGTGQVSSENQLDLASKVSGTITSIKVAVGQHVSAGDLIATVDSTDAARSLQTAKISLAKLTQAAKPGDIADAQNSVQKSYSDGFTGLTGTFADMQTIMPGLKDLLYGQTGFLSDQKASYLNTSAQAYRNTASDQYDKTYTEYLAILTEYKNMSRASATSSIAQLISDTQTLAADVSSVVKFSQSSIVFIANTQPNYQAKDLATAQSNINTWSSMITSDISSLLNSQNSIASNENTLHNLIAGSDALDIQSAQLTVDQAQETYNNYFIRAPFSGTIGRLPVSVYGQAANGTVIATIIGDAKVATISLNEVDAAKVKAGQSVAVTFDAIDGLVATGTVESIDLVGTVSSGVVSYNAKIAINTQDARILPGMSLNVTITTFQKSDVLVVPTAAIKTANRVSTIQVLDSSVVNAYMQSLRAQAGATSTNAYVPGANASSTGFGGYRGSYNNASGTSPMRPNRQFSITLSSPSAPQTITVTTGSSDSSNTEIISGLEGGEWVVTRTVAASAATASASTAAPSILNSLSGGRSATGAGGIRTGGFSGGAPRGN